MLPGLALAAASSSCKILIFLVGEITSTLGVLEMSVMPAKLASLSNGSLVVGVAHALRRF